MKLNEINKLEVKLDFGHEVISVGEMAKVNKEIYFKYYDHFLDRGYSISPIKLKLNNKPQKPVETIFSGLFGVFDDSLPDGWGRLLLDRNLIKAGYQINGIHSLQRLSIVGEKGFGSLVYYPNFEYFSQPFTIDLDQINHEIIKVINEDVSEALDLLFKLGGNSNGARPKIHIIYDAENKKFISAVDQNGKNHKQPVDHWIIKFPNSTDHKDISKIEFAYYLMAKHAGLKISQSELFNTPKSSFFGTKRFDRTSGNILHLHSVAGLVHDNFRMSNLDYGHVMDLGFNLEKNVNVYSKVLKLAAFNIYSHNKDDHSKNISFLMDSKGKWEMAPAYDLTFSNTYHGHQSMLVAGESQNPGKVHLKKLADSFGVKDINVIIDQIKSSVQLWPKFADEALIKKATIKEIGKVLEQKLKN